MAFNPTPEQEKAIYCSSGTLVSAAAGSGKTAVLVERVIDKICGNNPVGIDRLLVVTFTKAAAEEMLGRIERRLNEIHAENPENTYIIEQKIKLRNAKICTIDSFCIDLIRENFDRAGISPDFSVADDAVKGPLIQKAISAVINEAFEENSEEFAALIDSVSNDYDEGDLATYIKSIYEFADNMPFPKFWLEELCKRSTSDEFFDFLKNCAFEYANEVLSVYAKNLFDAVTALKCYDKVFDKYEPVLTQCANDILIIANYCKNKDWDNVCRLVSSFTSETLSTPRGYGDNPIVISAKELKKGVKETIDELSNLFSYNEKILKTDFDESYGLINSLLKLTIRFMEIYEEYRKEKNVMTFADTTHCALSLLCKIEDGKVVKTDFANEIISRFDEVLVDEFQDTNDMQNLLFSILSNDEKNIFIVGDIKQSIYRFRGANPKNFMEKKKKYALCTEENENSKTLKKIILSSNFRSRFDICEFVNLIFTAVMNGKLSTVEYNEEEILKPKAQYPESTGNSVTIQITNIAAAADKFEGEAHAIADYIERVMANDSVFDEKTKTMRSPKYSDFTVLFRSIKTAGPIYADVLRSRGIPVLMQKVDFLNAAEINFMFSLLRIIENPTLDIPLTAVMMSPVFRFTAEEMARLRVLSPNTSIISAVANRAVAGDEKCNEFLTILKKLRNLFSTASIGETIDYIYNYTDLLNVMSVLDGGEVRRKNLLLLQSMAKQYDTNNFSKRIEKFISHINKLTEKGVSANVSVGDAVKFMTIHASKGLQFPVCILANTVEHFSTKDSNDKLLISSDLGVSFKVNDFDAGKQKSFITRNIISVAARQEQLDEEMRLLYVALTRAKEKLLICITQKEVLSRPCLYSVPINSTVNIDQYRKMVTDINSYADMIWFALMADEKMQNIVLNDDIPRNTFSKGVYDVFVTNYNKTSVTATEQASTVEDVVEEQLDDENDIADAIRKNIYEAYPFAELKDIESKAAVAVIAHKAEEKDYSFTSRPAFMYKNGLTPAGRGTATHRFMQFADFEKAESDVSSEIERLYEWEFISYNEKITIDISAVKHFFESDLYRRMKNAKKVSREMRFLTEIPAGEINADLNQQLREEMVVVQGSVDCVFVEDDGIVVVDFKTDRISDASTLVDTYSKQLEIYASACEKIFGLPIKEKIIYSFNLSKEISF